MTCIVGLVEDGKIYMGADSAGSSSWQIATRADLKVFKNDQALFGFTSSFRMGQLLRYSFIFPEHPDGVDIDKFMCTTFINAVRDCLKSGGYAKKNDDQESGGTFLIGYRGRLFTIFDDYQVASEAYPYYAIGCGDQIALGALHATDPFGMEPKKRIIAALTASAEFSNGVRGPFHVECLEG